MTDDIEAEITEKGLTAPRITLEDINALIVDEVYFTAKDGFANVVRGAEVDRDGQRRIDRLLSSPLDQLTFCVLIMKNGFTASGHSACASPENFDAAVGRKVARQKAIEQLYPILGYELRTKLSSKT